MIEFDEALLRECAAKAEEELLAEIPRELHGFSRSSQRKMRQLLRDQGRSGLGKDLARVGRAAVAMLAAVLLLNMVLVGTVEAYREEVWELTLRVKERFTEFRVTGEPTEPASDFIPIEPPYIPEGYVETERLKSNRRQSIAYADENGRDFVYFQRLITPGTVVLDTEDALAQMIEICNREAQLIIEEEVIQIHWIYGEYSFSLIGNAAFDDLKKIAESILQFLEK